MCEIEDNFFFVWMFVSLFAFSPMKQSIEYQLYTFGIGQIWFIHVYSNQNLIQAKCQQAYEQSKAGYCHIHRKKNEIWSEIWSNKIQTTFFIRYSFPEAYLHWYLYVFVYLCIYEFVCEICFKWNRSERRFMIDKMWRTFNRNRAL